MRRCFSYCDLTSAPRRLDHTDHNIIDSGSSDSCDSYEDLKPIKRSRSDQSLSTTAQLAAAAAAAAGTAAGSSAGPLQHGVACHQCHDSQYGMLHPTQSLPSNAYSYGYGAKVQRFPSLPVVLSDVGSSCNSLLSLDSETSRSVGSQSHTQLLELLGSPAAIAAAAAAVGSPAGAALLPGDTALLRKLTASNKRGSGALYTLTNSCSAVSLTQAQHDLERTASDASMSSSGYLASLQQLLPPVLPYSPPPLFSPGPPPLQNQGSGSLPLPGFGFGLKGGSIQQQKQAGFQPPVPLAGTGPAARTAGASPAYVRGAVSMSSLDSVDSIASVEAGEHLVRLGGFHQGGLAQHHSAGTLKAAAGGDFRGSGSATAVASPPTSTMGGSADTPTTGGASRAGEQRQQLQQHDLAPPPATLQTAVESPVAGVGDSKSVTSSNPSPLPPPGPSRLGLPRISSNSSLQARLTGAGNAAIHTSSVTNIADASKAAAAAAFSNSMQQQLRSPEQPPLPSPARAESVKSALGSPSIELQVMGSMLGNEGEQWLFVEGSSGAIGPSPIPSTDRLEVAAHQLRNLPAATAGAAPTAPAGAGADNGGQSCTAAAAAAAAHMAAVNAVQGLGPSAAGSTAVTARPTGAWTSTTTTAAALPAPSRSAFGFGAGGAAAAAASKLGFANAAGGASALDAAAAAKAAFMPQEQQQGRTAYGTAVQAAFAGAPSHSRPQVSAFASHAGGSAAVPATATAAAAAAAAVPHAARQDAVPTEQPNNTVWQSAPLPTAGNTAPSALASRAPGDSWRHSGSHYYQQQMQQQGVQQQRGAGLQQVPSYPWSFQRRPASFDCARPSTRRRGSLELNMPWRTKLDAVIAQVVTEAPDASLTVVPSPSSPHSPASDLSDRLGSRNGSGVPMMEAVEPFAVEAGDPFETDAVASNAYFHHAQQQQQQQSVLDLLLPLPGGDQPVVDLADLGRHKETSLTASRGARLQQLLGMDSQNGTSGSSGVGSSGGSSSGGSSSSSSGASVAADHGLPGSTNIGGYIGGCDALGTAVPGLEDMSEIHSYGLEVDGAMSLQLVDTSEAYVIRMQNAAAEGSGSGKLSQQGHYHSKHYGSRTGLSQAQEEEIARMGTPRVDSRLRHVATGRQQQAPAAAASADVHSPRAAGLPAAAVPPTDLHHHHHQQQQHVSHLHMKQQNVVVLVEVDEEEEDESAALGVDSKQQLTAGSTGRAPTPPSVASATSYASPSQPEPAIALQPASSIGSIGSSVSSISSRGAGSGFYKHRGAGSSSSGAAYELFVRLNRARQTLDFAKRQAQAFADLDKAELGVWEALDLLNGLREYEAALLTSASGSARSSSGGGGGGGGSAGGANFVPEVSQQSVYGTPLVSQGSLTEEPLTADMSLKEHALQVAELCRLSFPDKPWMALVGLLHGLGKLLAHPLWGSQPQWAVAGESYPVGCRFAPQISHSEFFSANPDRRRRTLSTALGIYSAGCGLRNVYMSWAAPEYLYMALVLNQTELPEEALFMIRYQRCTAITRPGGAYRNLMSEQDKSLLPLLAAFQSLIAYRRVQLPPEALKGQELIDHYDQLIAQYLGEEKLFW